MTLIHFLRNQRTIYAFIVVSAIILLPFAGAFAESDKKPKPMPMTTNNPDISKEELAYRIQPLTKDDLSVEALYSEQIPDKYHSYFLSGSYIC